MCCCNCPCFYKARIVILAALSLCEAVFGLFRVYIVVSPALLVDGPFDFSNIANITDRIAIAFLLDWASSITATFMGILMLLFIALFLFICCLACCCASCRTGSAHNRTGCCNSLAGLKALHRFVSLNCNCPCYRARPKLRLRVRFVFLFLCLALRGAAIYLYWSVSETDERGLSNFYFCLISLVFLIGTLVLDLYQYVVWWCYTPQIDTRCHCRSRKHKRYIPHHIVGDAKRKDILGDRPCTTDPCRNRHLSHVVLFHGKNYKPQPRWSMLKKDDPKATYIGFHTTTPEAAVSIVHSEFRLTEKGMLGKGVYFARSIEDTIGKAKGGEGACIIAEIRMGKVYEFDRNTIFATGKGTDHNRELRNFVQSSEWHKKYNTCYMNHPNENKDEFCIKDPEKQIIKWVVVIDKEHDNKVAQYGLDTEFDSTKCYCI